MFYSKQIGPDGQIVIDEDETEIDKENEKIIKENDGGDEGDGDDSVPAPQVTIGADGQIVLNEARFEYILSYHCISGQYINRSSLVQISS